MVQLFCDVSVFLQPTRGKEVPEKVQKKCQQSQEVCALIKYTCYPLLCLLDLWSTFGGLMQLKQIPLLIYSSIWEIRNFEISNFVNSNFLNFQISTLLVYISNIISVCSISCQEVPARPRSPCQAKKS